MSALFTPYALGPMALVNRIAIAPMCQYSAVEGNATEWHMIHLGSLALSGASLLTIEATAVEAIGRITPDDLGLYNDENQAALAPVLAAIRKHSHIKVAVQLAHAGRKASSHAPWKGGQQIKPDEPGGWDTAAPSAVPHNTFEVPPLALDDAGLARIKAAFARAAERSHALGIDAIELHFAHGYLMHQFLSPLANQRTDGYGGSLENRMRFPLEVFEAVRAAVPASMPVGVRLSASDWVEEGGWDVAQSIVLGQALAARGCAFMHVSSGGVSPQQKIPLVPGYQVPFAERMKEACGMPTFAVGLITEPAQAEEIVASGQADVVALARAILFDPHWPWHAAAALGATVEAPPQYWRSQPREMKNLFGDVKIGAR